MIENKEELIQKAYDLGFKVEQDYGGCGQCTMIAVLETLGIENPSLVKAATALAGGCGRMCDGVCGGYAGGSLVMSSIIGRRQEAMDGDFDDKIKAHDMTVKLRQLFINEYGSIICGDIHKDIYGRNFNMWNQIELEQFDEDGAHSDKCTSVVGKAARETVRIILDAAEEREMSLEDIRKSANPEITTRILI